MIRPLTEEDFDAVIAIVNEAWRTLYAGYVSPAMLNDAGGEERAGRLREDFRSHRLKEYVWEEAGRVLGMLSCGDTADEDRPGAFEVWRLYLAPEARGRGIGGKLLVFAEDRAREAGYTEAVIWAFQENTRAAAFYESHGYQVDKEEYFGEPYHAWAIRRRKVIGGKAGER